MNTIDPPFVFNADYGHARSYRYERLLCNFYSFIFSFKWNIFISVLIFLKYVRI